MIEASSEQAGVNEQTQGPHKNSFGYMFRQQLISAWKPVPTPVTSFILYTALTIFFATVGVVMFIFTNQQNYAEVRYDQTCSGQTTCTLSFTISKDISAPVYLYYGLTEFYQNHRKYMKYRSTTQLEAGTQFSSLADARSACSQRTTNGEMGWNLSSTGATLNPNDIAFPCGYVAYSYFNDSYSSLQGPNSTSFSISESGIAWPVDKANTKNWDLTKQKFSVEDEHWLVWLRPSVRKDSYKLWGIVNQKMPAGQYSVQIANNFPVSFGQKWLQLTSADAFGSNHQALAIAYLVAAGVSLILMVTFLIVCVKDRLEMEAKRRQLQLRSTI